MSTSTTKQAILRVQRPGRLTVVEFCDRDQVDFLPLARADDEIHAIIQENDSRELAFDMTHIDFVNSVVLGFLVGLLKDVGRIHLYNPSDFVREVIEAANLGTTIRMHKGWQAGLYAQPSEPVLGNVQETTNVYEPQAPEPRVPEPRAPEPDEETDGDRGAGREAEASEPEAPMQDSRGATHAADERGLEPTMDFDAARAAARETGRTDERPPAEQVRDREAVERPDGFAAVPPESPSVQGSPQTFSAGEYLPHRRDHRREAHEMTTDEYGKELRDHVANEIRGFEGTLDDAYEVTITVGDRSFALQRVTFRGNSVVVFSGVDREGVPVQLMQHLRQLSVALSAGRRTDPEHPRQRIGLLQKSFPTAEARVHV